MKHRTKILSVSRFLVCLCLVAVILPGCNRSQKHDMQDIDQTMYLMEIKRDGSTVDMGTIELYATFETNADGETCIRLPSLLFDSYIFSTTTNNTDMVKLDQADLFPFHRVIIPGFHTKEDKAFGAYFFLSYDFSRCMIEADNRIFVASVSADFDPSAALAHFNGLFVDKRPEHPHLPWEMNAALVTSGGAIVERFEITVTGSVTTYGSKDQLDLHIHTPETFRYYYDRPIDGPAVSFDSKTAHLPYYVWSDYSYDRTSADYRVGHYALCPEKGYLIMSWDDGEDLFLVASRDTDTDPSTILDYFQGFIDHYAFEH